MNRRCKSTLASACAWLLLALASTVFIATAAGQERQGTRSGSATAAQSLPDFVQLVRTYGPAVVNISTTRTARADQSGLGMPEGDPGDLFYELLRRFFSQQPFAQEFEARTLGSGFIIASDGHILTNAHVVADTDEILVRLTNKREYKARVIGLDLRTDVALLKIDARDLPTVRIGDPKQLEVGEWVAAIGAPFGFENSVTAGIVSAKGRLFPQESYTPFIQTDVAVNPGNSGGPLFNLRGEVVGINSMIYSRTGGFMGLSFAIPIDLAMEIATELRTRGRVTRGRIGVAAQPLTPELAESFGLRETTGALVVSVDRDGPADRAGIHAGDVILRVNDQPIGEPGDLTRLIAATRPGTRVTIEIWRRGAREQVQLVVGELAADRLERRPSQPDAKPNRLGLTVSELTDTQRRLLDVQYGVLIRSVSGAAQQAGLRAGDVIVAVNDLPVNDLATFNQLVEQAPGRIVALLVRRGQNTLYAPIPLR